MIPRKKAAGLGVQGGLPNTEQNNYNALPAEMKESRRWLLWKLIPNRDPTKKPRKVPFYTNGIPRNGKLDTSDDLEKLATFEQACSAFQNGKYTGLGFALGPDGTGQFWQGIDFDDLSEHPELGEIVEKLPGYVETSPSGKGVHAIGYGSAFKSLGSNGTGIEAYASARYFTVTGKEGDGLPTCLADFVEQPLISMHSGKSTHTASSLHEPEATERVSHSTIADLRSALTFLRADDRELWVRMGFALKNLGDVGRGLWLDWSATSTKFNPQTDAGTWDTFKPTHTGYQAIFAEAQKQGWLNPAKKIDDVNRSVNCFIDSEIDFAADWGKGFEDIDDESLLQPLCISERAKNGSESQTRNNQHQGQAESKEKAEWQPFPLIRADELTAKPIALDWLVENIIERGSLNLLFGEPGAGKSLFALDWAFCMAAGIGWHGHRTQQIDVVVIAGEGHAGMARRLKALESKYSKPAPERLYISQRPAQLLDPNNTQWVADTIKATCPNPGLVIVDTLHRNMEGDENSSQDIGKVISNLDNFLKPLGAAVLVVHHSGHGPKDRSRGSSSIRAAMDGEFSAAKDGGAIVLNSHKTKDFEPLKPLQFRLKQVTLDWCDWDGFPLTSVYLEHDGEAKPTAKKCTLSARDDAILTSLREAIAEHGIEPTAEIKEKYGGFDGLMGMGRKIVHIDHWRDKAYKRLDVETPDAKQKAFKRCRDKLFELGKVIDYDGYWWLIYD